MFKLTCAELQEWIQEKDNAFYDDDVGKDLQSAKNLHRKHMVNWIVVFEYSVIVKLLMDLKINTIDKFSLVLKIFLLENSPSCYIV